MQAAEGPAWAQNHVKRSPSCSSSASPPDPEGGGGGMYTSHPTILDSTWRCHGTRMKNARLVQLTLAAEGHAS